MSTRSVVAAVGVDRARDVQLALAMGAPLAPGGIGGTETQLPTGLRITSAVAVILWTIGALVILVEVAIRCGLITAGVFRIGTSLLVGLLPIGVLMNVASSSESERFG